MTSEQPLAWNPWKLTSIGMALVIVTALVTGLVVATWKGSEPAVPGAAPGTVAAIGGIAGGGGGTLYGLARSRSRDERYRAAYASCLRARGYAG